MSLEGSRGGTMVSSGAMEKYPDGSVAQAGNPIAHTSPMIAATAERRMPLSLCPHRING
jgi:hypothetical protein